MGIRDRIAAEDEDAARRAALQAAADEESRRREERAAAEQAPVRREFVDIMRELRVPPVPMWRVTMEETVSPEGLQGRDDINGRSTMRVVDGRYVAVIRPHHLEHHTYDLATHGWFFKVRDAWSDPDVWSIVHYLVSVDALLYGVRLDVAAATPPVAHTRTMNNSYEFTHELRLTFRSPRGTKTFTDPGDFTSPKIPVVVQRGDHPVALPANLESYLADVVKAYERSGPPARSEYIVPS